MDVEEIRQSLTDAIWFVELAYNEQDDIPHLRSLLDEVVYLIQEVLNHLDESELDSENSKDDRQLRSLER